MFCNPVDHFKIDADFLLRWILKDNLSISLLGENY